MGFFDEMMQTMDLRCPRIILTDEMAVLENVANIIMLSETSVTVSHGLIGAAARRLTGKAPSVYTTITGTNLVIREICEGRLLIGGKIQRAEFFQPPDTH
ncbi:MAG: YabP/YqfC family sporulation protein [Firmicutes bacterium]|nr:YabP/YqfC family sporulation protein [Bacillota bacterium]